MWSALMEVVNEWPPLVESADATDLSSYPFVEVDLWVGDDFFAEVDKVFTLKKGPVLEASIFDYRLKGSICVSVFITGD